MIVLLASAFGAVLLVGMVLGVWLERAANRRARGGTIDFTLLPDRDWDWPSPPHLTIHGFSSQT